MSQDWRNRRTISVDELTEQLHSLGVEPGDVLLVHTSFRAVRPVENGPDGLIDALQQAVAPNGTVVMPSWGADDDNPFDPASSPTDPDLGIVADMFWRQPGVIRSDHPMAFAAFGPDAAAITGGPLPLPPHRPESPVGRVHDLDGKVLLLGCEHDANTTLHLAELIAGVPYRIRHHVTILEDGVPTRIDVDENDHCCQRFNLADEWLRSRGLLNEGQVGHAHARLMRSRDVVTVAGEFLKDDLLLFLHPQDAGCEECELAWASLSK